MKRLFLLLLFSSFALGQSKLNSLEALGAVYGSGDDVIYIWVSPSCPYCKKFHNKYLPQLLKLDFKIVYFVVMRSNRDLALASKFYCSEDRKAVVESFFTTLPYSADMEVDCSDIAIEMSNIAISYAAATPVLVFSDESIIKGLPNDDEHVVYRHLKSILTDEK